MNISREGIKKAIRSGWQNTRRNTRNILTRLPYVLLASGLILGVASGVNLYQIRNAQKSQIAAERWQGVSGVPYRQISCFAKGQPQAAGGPDIYLHAESSLNVAEIEQIRERLDTTIKSSFGKDDDSESGKPKPETDESTTNRIWIDAYSAQSDCTINRKASDISIEESVEVNVTGISGDYYLIHPLPMEAGAFLSSDTLDTKKIVLDKELSFRLFGTYNSIGKSVFINDREYMIIGVVRHPDTDIDSKTQGDYLRAYILFSELTFLTAEDDQGSEFPVPGSDSSMNMQTEEKLNSLAVTCYEVVIPNRISGIALQNLYSAFEAVGKQDKNYFFVDNTDRFSLLRLWDVAFPAGEMQMERAGYKLPFWEASASMAESASIFWWAMLFAGTGMALTSGLTIYIGVVKRKFS